MLMSVAGAIILLAFEPAARAQAAEPVFPEFQDTFPLFDCRLSPHGVNTYFMPLIPNFRLLLEGEEEGETGTVLIQVLRRTRVVDGVRCAVIRETEWVDDGLVEISWNYIVICLRHRDVFYYGEDVDIYEDGEVVSHDGAWLAGEDGAMPGLLMPGYPLVGSRYYQEIAPGVAQDRAEHLSVTEIVATPAGTFDHCLLVEESTPLEPGELSYKHYAPGVGLITDDFLELVDYGFGDRYRKSRDDDEEEDDDD